MLKRVIENYLRASTEREYDIPFRQLLWAMGYELLDSEIKHHPFEFGKDMRAAHKDKSPRVWLFQTKYGDISQSDWSDMERQLKLMLVMPVNHPNVGPEEPKQAIWVCSGELKPTVSPIMFAFNQEYVAHGHLPVEVWNITKLVELFEEYFFSINICPDTVLLDVISLISSFNQGSFNLKQYQSILDRLLPESLLAEKPPKNAQTLATVEIIAHYVLGRAYEVDDLYAAIDAIQLTIIMFWKFGLKSNFENDLLASVDRLHELLLKTIDDLTKTLSATFAAPRGLVSSRDQIGMILIYPHRTLEMLGVLAYRAWIANLFGEEQVVHQYITYIENVIENNPPAAHPIWERVQEDILLTGYVLWLNKKNETARKWISALAAWVATMYAERGGIARPKASNREVIEQLFGYQLSFVNADAVNTSYLCWTIAELCYWFDLKEIYLDFIQKVNQVRLIEFVYGDEATIYEEDLEGGYREQVVPPSNWDKFKEWYKARYAQESLLKPQTWTPYTKQRVWLLLIVSSYFGNRVFSVLFRNNVLKRPT